MRRIPLGKFEGFTTAEILRTVMENAPRGVNVGEMRKRVRVLDAIDRAEKNLSPAIDLEDADHATLRAAVETFEFAKATPELLAALDAVIEAKEPEAAAAE